MNSNFTFKNYGNKNKNIIKCQYGSRLKRSWLYCVIVPNEISLRCGPGVPVNVLCGIMVCVEP